jgi:hypothetical protein
MNKQPLCDKNCMGTHCNRDLKWGICHLLTPVLVLAAHRNPNSLIRGMDRAGYRYDSKSDSFVVAQ